MWNQCASVSPAVSRRIDLEPLNVQAARRKVDMNKDRAVAKLLVQKKDRDPSGWWWISDSGLKRLTKKRANKYLLACILDYQMNANTAWEKAERFAEKDLGDPDCLWEEITRASLSTWNENFHVHSLHRFSKAHERVWNIGKRVIEQYAGDARKIWTGLRSRDVVEKLVALGVGPQLSRMTVGGLRDCGWISGPSDVKADRFVKRVLGRVFTGDPMTEDGAILLARRLYPRDPWLLDSGLFQIGQNHCHLSSPGCGECSLRPHCTYSAIFVRAGAS